MPATTYMINNSLNHDFGSDGYTPPSSYWLGLSTTLVDASGAITEPTDASYDRVEIANSDRTNWSTAVSGSIVTSGSFSFPESSTAWGTIYSVFLADAQTSGSVLYYFTAEPAFPVVANMIVTYGAGTISITRT